MQKHGNTDTMKHNFIKCGLTGWLLEVLWTGFLSFRRRDMHLTGTTSIWMFPIYGAAGLFAPLCNKIKHIPAVMRGCIYTVFIFIVEFASGTFLRKQNWCPWDYSKARYNIKGVIRLDYAPLWFATGLIMERRLLKPPPATPSGYYGNAKRRNTR